MKREEKPHLDEEQLSRAVVDEADLSTSLRKHLSQCSECLGAKERLELDLTGLGRMAARLAPSPRRRVSLTPITKTTRRTLTWRFAGGPALGMALVIIVAGWFFLFRTTSQDRLTALTVEMWEDYDLLTEIEALAENPLPLSLQITAEESYSTFDEDFVDFLVPDIGSQELPDDQAKKGNWLC